MKRKNICFLLTASLIFSTFGMAYTGYAHEMSEIYSETLSTIPVNNTVLANNDEVNVLHDSDDGSNSTAADNSDADASGKSDDLPDGVVQMVYKTTSVDGNESESKFGNTSPDAREVIGKSSLPDEDELELIAPDVVNMVMPVIPEDTYDFVIDSQDLLSRFSVYKDSYEKSSLYFTNTTGEKSHTAISDAAVAKNKSSVPVLLYVSLQIDNEYGWPVTYTDMGTVFEGDDTNISFALIPVSSNEDSMDDSLTIHKDAMISIDDTGHAEMILYLPGTPDNFDMEGDRYITKEDAVWSSLGFAVTGACNTNADWKNIDELSSEGQSIGIHISYRMEILSDEQKEMLDNGISPDPDTGVVVFD